MMLYEFLLTEIDTGNTNEMDCITEYLIMADVVTIKEAKELIVLVEQEKESKLAAAGKWLKEKKEAIKNAYGKRINTAKARLQQAKLNGKKDIVNSIIVQINKLKESMQAALAKVGEQYNKMKTSILSKADGTSRFAKLKAMKKFVPKSNLGKLAAVTGLSVAGAAGYKGYKAYKNKKAAKA